MSVPSLKEEEGGYSLMTIARNRSNLVISFNKYKTRQLWIGWLFLAPALISFTLFKYYPIILGIFVSFFRVDIMNLPGEFAGFANYIRAFGDHFFITALRNNIEFFIIGVFMAFWPPILLATLINEVRKGKTFMRTIYFLPAVAPGIAMMVLWRYIWQPDFGLANYIMRLLDLPLQLWLNDANMVKFVMWFPSMVMGGGMNMLIYLAALQNVPQEQHESALIDGAGFLRRIWSISLPQILPVVNTMFILAIIFSFNMFDNVLVMTGGGPQGATETIIMYSFKQAITWGDYGYATAISTIAFVIILFLTIFQMFVVNRDKEAALERKLKKKAKTL